MRLAVLITCHNRKDYTLRCLNSLYRCVAVVPFDVFLVDDDSSDGTYEAVSSLFPSVFIIKGDGDLFWSRGMLKAWKAAISHNSYDYFLWLNDDVVLYDTSLVVLFDVLMCFGMERCLVTGMVEDEYHNIIYCGYDAQRRIVDAIGKCSSVTYLNGNVVLIPSQIVSKIGLIDSFYWHDLGDVDYGLTALDNGFRLVSTPVPVALGTPNVSSKERIRLCGVSLIKRFKHLNTPLGCPPKIFFYYKKKHWGLVNALISVAYLIVINVFPDTLYKLFRSIR